MAVKTLVGNLFESKAQTLVNTVNTVGVMGKGIALEFRKRFPEMHRDYLRRCAAGQVRLGEPYLFRSLVPPWVLNFPTKEHWRAVSRVSDIVRGLQYLEARYRDWGIASLAVPPLGCGLGQLEWRVVGPTLYRHLDRLDIPVELFAPHGTPAEQLEPAFLGSEQPSRPGQPSKENNARIDAAAVALAEILARIEREPYHWPVGRTTFQKIAYFATEEGIPTRLDFVPQSYGPFSSDVKPLLTRLVNNGLLVERKLGRMFRLQPGPTLADASNAFKTTLSEWEETLDRIADLFLRMNTQQAEIAATVFYAARHLVPIEQSMPTENDVLSAARHLVGHGGAVPSAGEVLAAVKQWKRRRRPELRDEDIAVAIRNLSVLGWLKTRPSEDLPLPEAAAVEA